MVERRWYAVEHAGASGDEQKELCRSVLRVLASDAATFQTDIVHHEPSEWGAETHQAAAALRQRSKKPNDEYTSVGWIDVDSESWPTFVLVAPWALDAGAFDHEGDYFISMHDEGGMVLHVTEDQARRVQAALPSGSMRPIHERPGVLRRGLKRLRSRLGGRTASSD